MRNLKIWLQPTLVIIVAIIIWAIITWLGIASIVSNYRAGFLAGPIINTILLIPITMWLIFDVILPIIKETRSLK